MVTVLQGCSCSFALIVSSSMLFDFIVAYVSKNILFLTVMQVPDSLVNGINASFV